MRSPPCLKARGTPRAGYFVHRRGRASAQRPFRPHVPVIFPCSLAARGNRLEALFPMIPGAARGGILLDKIPQNRRLRTILGPNSQSTRNIPCAAGRLKAVLFFTALSAHSFWPYFRDTLPFLLADNPPVACAFASDCPAKCFRGT